MKDLRLLMGMPIWVEIVGEKAQRKHLDKIFEYFEKVEERFSTFRETSEISKYNLGVIKESEFSPEMKLIFKLAELTKFQTNGYFDIKRPNGEIDPAGIVKGWAIWEASKLIEKMGFENYFVDAGGDVQVKGKNSEGKDWRIGIRNPFNREENVKVVSIGNRGIATSGTYIRGQHVFDPHNPAKPIEEVVSITVIGPNVYEADRMATAALAMREKGVAFIAKLEEMEAYAIDHKGMATFTPGFNKFVIQA